ncbi:alpha/beta-hydrolase [Neocallimastix californiae]|uniref:Alpha/beta-hydrolase n=1 Tax=Neocallimastix californiae TaxID=1754190 RepID=A0A1Y2AYL5_9FUNG|nr:alpha/beta-hydrolase [Neocallimastix californiae]|eukprot:ORY27390.1 alpha/beta-hydrolase [Neocallimastix californiae]
MQSSIFIKFLLLISVVFSFSHADFINDLKDRKRDIENYLNAKNVERDIVYNKVDSVLDVYNNKNEGGNTLKPVVIFIYGGTWYQGDKVKFTRFGTLLEENGYVGVIPTYTLFPYGGMEDMVYDVYTAITWTFENIEKYGGDPNRITVAGHSAGAHLVALTLFKSYNFMENKKEIMQPLPKIEKALLMSGPYDFDDYAKVKSMLGKELKSSLLEQLVRILFKTKDVSPYDIVKDIPDNSVDDGFNVNKFLFYYTSLDTTVPECSAQKLMKEMKRASEDVNIEYVYNEGYIHEAITVGIRKDDKEQAKIFLNLLHQ